MTLTLTNDSRWELHRKRFSGMEDRYNYDCHIDIRHEGSLVATLIVYKGGRTTAHPYYGDRKQQDNFPSVEDATAWVVATYLLD